MSSSFDRRTSSGDLTASLVRRGESMSSSLDRRSPTSSSRAVQATHRIDFFRDAIGMLRVDGTASRAPQVPAKLRPEPMALSQT